MYSVVRTQLNAQGELSTYFPLSHSVNFFLFQPSVLILRVLVTLVFLHSAYLLNPGSLPVSAFVLPLRTVAWKCSQSSRLGQLQGSLHFPSCLSGPLLFLDWFTVFCKLLFPIYVAGIRIDLVTVTSSQLEAKLSLSLSLFLLLPRSCNSRHVRASSYKGRDPGVSYRFTPLCHVSPARSYSLAYTVGASLGVGNCFCPQLQL